MIFFIFYIFVYQINEKLAILTLNWIFLVLQIVFLTILCLFSYFYTLSCFLFYFLYSSFFISYYIFINYYKKRKFKKFLKKFTKPYLNFLFLCFFLLGSFILYILVFCFFCFLVYIFVFSF